MLKQIANALWGKFESKEELRKFLFLGLIFGLIIGVYWALRPMKDSLFNAIVGIAYQPYAKLLSILIVFPLVMIYGKLIDMYPRQRVFYILVAIYGILSLLLFFAFSHPTIGLANTIKGSDRVLGWFWYVFVESFGSLFPALFWAFTTDTTTSESAKRGFSLVALFGQLGNMFGPLVLNAKRLGFMSVAPVVGISAFLIFFTGFLFWYFIRTTPEDQLKGYHAEKEETTESEPGFFEGLKLLFTKGYLLGIFLIIIFFEVIVTVFDYHFKTAVFETIPNTLDADNYLNMYAIMTGVVSTACVLLGINNIQRRLGMNVSLLTLPLLVALATLLIKFNPHSLVIAFWIMVLSKAVNYALNQPTLKQLYIPTSKDTKYKAQAWIEMFGSRGSKGTGSLINTYRAPFVAQYGALDGIARFLTFSAFISFGILGMWFFIALYVSRTYDKAIKEKRIVC